MRIILSTLLMLLVLSATAMAQTNTGPTTLSSDTGSPQITNSGSTNSAAFGNGCGRGLGYGRSNANTGTAPQYGRGMNSQRGSRQYGRSNSNRRGNRQCLRSMDRSGQTRYNRLQPGRSNASGSGFCPFQNGIGQMRGPGGRF